MGALFFMKKILKIGAVFFCLYGCWSLSLRLKLRSSTASPSALAITDDPAFFSVPGTAFSDAPVDASASVLMDAEDEDKDGKEVLQVPTVFSGRKFKCSTYSKALTQRAYQVVIEKIDAAIIKSDTKGLITVFETYHISEPLTKTLPEIHWALLLTECSLATKKTDEVALSFIKALMYNKSPKEIAKIINHPDENGRTVLHYACSLGNLAVVKLLIPFANVHKRDCMHRSPMHYACGIKVITERLLFNESCIVASKEAFEKLPIFHYSRQMQAMRTAPSAQTRLEIIKLLIAYESSRYQGDIFAVKDRYERTPLDYAQDFGLLDIINEYNNSCDGVCSCIIM